MIQGSYCYLKGHSSCRAETGLHETLHSSLCLRLPGSRFLSLAVSEAGIDHFVFFVFVSSELTLKELREESERRPVCARLLMCTPSEVA